MLFEADDIIIASQRAGANPIPSGYEIVNIDRKSWYGNPFNNESDRETSIFRHKQWFNELSEDHRIKKGLRVIARRIVKHGKKVALVCWCCPKKCHGDIYIEYVNTKKN